MFRKANTLFVLVITSVLICIFKSVTFFESKPKFKERHCIIDFLKSKNLFIDNINMKINNYDDFYWNETEIILNDTVYSYSWNEIEVKFYKKQLYYIECNKNELSGLVGTILSKLKLNDFQIKKSNTYYDYNLVNKKRNIELCYKNYEVYYDYINGKFHPRVQPSLLITNYVIVNKIQQLREKEREIKKQKIIDKYTK
jgi:hypothetical protein